MFIGLWAETTIDRTTPTDTGTISLALSKSAEHFNNSSVLNNTLPESPEIRNKRTKKKDPIKCEMVDVNMAR